MRIRGIGQVKALQLLAVMEFAKRILQEEESSADAFDTPRTGRSALPSLVAGEAVEHFWVLCLDRKHRLLRCVEVTKGTATNSLVHSREVFREAIKLSATAIIAVHNHPSGDLAQPRRYSGDPSTPRSEQESSGSICSTTSSSVRRPKTLRGWATIASMTRGSFRWKDCG